MNALLQRIAGRILSESSCWCLLFLRLWEYYQAPRLRLPEWLVKPGLPLSDVPPMTPGLPLFSTEAKFCRSSSCKLAAVTYLCTQSSTGAVLIIYLPCKSLSSCAPAQVNLLQMLHWDTLPFAMSLSLAVVEGCTEVPVFFPDYWKEVMAGGGTEETSVQLLGQGQSRGPKAVLSSSAFPLAQRSVTWPPAAAPITGLSPGGGRVVKSNPLDGVLSKLAQNSGNPSFHYWVQ